MDTQDKTGIFLANASIKQPNGVETGIGWDRFLRPEAPPEPEAPTFSETAAANFRQYNIPYRAFKKLKETDFSSIGLIGREEGFDPIAEGFLDNLPEQYAMRILTARNKKEAQLRLANINQELEDQQTAARSGLISNMVTSFGASFLDPTTLIPVGQTIKYLDTSKAFFGNFKNVATQLGPIIAAQDAFLVASKETKGIQDWVLDTTTDTFFAASIGGVLGKFASKKLNNEMQGAKAHFKASDIDLDIVAEVNAKGEFEKFVIPESSVKGVGAAEVKDIEALLNSGNTSFHQNKYIKHIFGLGSPVVRGATSTFDVVKQITTGLWGTNFRTAGGVAKAIADPGAYDFVRSWSGLGAGLKAEKISAYLEWNGIEGIGGRIRAIAGVKSGKYRSELEFNELITKAVRRGTSDDPIVARVAEKYRKVFNELWSETKKRFPDLTDHEFSNIKNHVMRLYDKSLIQANPEKFVSNVYSYLSNVNQRIVAYQQPYTSAKERGTLLRTQLKALKGVPGSRDKKIELQRLIKDNDATIKQINKKKRDDIRSGVIGLDMLQDKVRVTPEQARALDVIQKPVKELKAQLKKVNNKLKTTGTIKNLKELLQNNPAIKGIQSAELTSLSEKLEKMGAVKARRSLMRFKRNVIDAAKNISKDSKNYRDLISSNIVDIKHAKVRQKELKQHLKDLEKKLTEAVLNKKEKRSIKTEIANVKDEILAHKKTVESLSSDNKELRIKIAELIDAKADMGIIKEVATDAKEHLGIDLQQTSLKELMQTIHAIDVTVKKTSRKTLKTGKAEISKLQAERKALNDLIKEENIKIKQKIINSEIPEDLLYVDKYGRLGLKDPNRLPDFRSIKSPDELKLSAESIRDTIMQLNEEQMAGAIFGKMRGTGSSTLRERAFLWNDAVAEPWLVNDIDTIADVYISGLSKHIHHNDVYAKFGGVEGVAKQLKNEYEFMRADILKEPPTPERAKKLSKLDKDLKNNQELLKKFDQAYFGSLADYSSTPYRVSNAIRQFTAGVLLTNMPLLMLTEFFTPTFKMGYKEFVHDGLVGTVAKVGKYKERIRADFIKEFGADMGVKKADAYLKGYFSDALVGVNRLQGQSLEARFGFGKQYYQKSVYERYADVTNKAIDLVSGASHIMDLQEVFQASANESRIMRILKRYVGGENLEKWEIHALDEARINPDKWAARMVKEYDRVGEAIDDGFISNFHLWNDFEAAQRFRIALDRGVRAVITKPGPADVPFIFKDPMAGLFFQFLSWPFAATNNFLLPALTEFDGQKLTGMLSMLGAGSLIGPLRQLAKGEEVDMSFEALASSALANSGLMGWQYDILSRAISYSNFKMLRDDGSDTPTNKAIRVLLPERHAGKGVSSLLGSPALGMIDMMGETFSAAVSGEFNQKSAERSIRMVAPWLYTWYTQDLIRKGLQATSLPETRREARGE